MTESISRSQAPQAAARPDPQNISNVTALGKAAWLWMNSPLHNEWPVYLLSRFLLPPIHLKQYELIERDGMPVAYCSWAHLNADTESQYLLDAAAIGLADWNNGDRLWFVDWIAPFSARDGWALRSKLLERFPDRVARAIRVKKDNRKIGRVMEFKGAAIDTSSARQLLSRYYTEFLVTCQRRGQLDYRRPLDTTPSAAAATAANCGSAGAGETLTTALR